MRRREVIRPWRWPISWVIICEARSLVVVCQRSLESVELGDESEALLVALELLRRTYNELDAFASQYSKSSRGV
jgi:hypothetical protein